MSTDLEGLVIRLIRACIFDDEKCCGLSRGCDPECPLNPQG